MRRAIHARTPQSRVAQRTRTLKTNIPGFGSATSLSVDLSCATATKPTSAPASPSSGSKQLQFVAGVPAHLYWLASWLWDGFMYLVVLSQS